MAANLSRLVCRSVLPHPKGRTDTVGRNSQQNTGRSAQGPSSPVMTLLCEQGSSGSLSFVCARQRLFDGRVCCCVDRLWGDNATPTSGRGRVRGERETESEKKMATAYMLSRPWWLVKCLLCPGATWDIGIPPPCRDKPPHAGSWLTGTTVALLRQGPRADFHSLSIMDRELLSS